MDMRFVCMALALALAGCQPAQDGAEAPRGSELSAPAAEAEPTRVFAALNNAARSTTGELQVGVSMRLPDQAGADASETLTLRAANGLLVEARITGAVSPATMVQGQTLRALLSLPVDEPQTLLYRVDSETRPAGIGALCGAEQATHVLVWEPSNPGENGLKLIGFTGGAPGAADARACPMLEYARR